MITGLRLIVPPSYTVMSDSHSHPISRLSDATISSVCLRTLGKVIFDEALCCKSSSPVDSSKMKAEKARCNMARGCSIVNSWDFLFEADPITLSSSSNTRTVSFIIMSSWDMALPSHTAFCGAILLVSFVWFFGVFF
jgi:hypothetical protein